MKITKRLAQALAVGVGLSLALTGCGGSGFNKAAPSASAPAAGQTAEANKNEVSVLIGASGEAEKKAVEEAVAAWSTKSGVPAKVIAATDLVQEAAQGFASGSPADVLYVSTDGLGNYAKAGNLLAYGDDLANKDDFYPALRDAFTVDGKLMCAPKDFSTLQLIINTDLWAAAGLTEADYPKTWDDLKAVSQKLTKGGVTGLAFGPEIQRIGVFLAQNGGGLVTDGKATANSDANVEALAFVKQGMTDGWMAYSSDLGAGWGGEALGKKMAAMVIEGNWITGAMKSDYSDVKYAAVELPAGKSKGTLQYTNCWGVAAKGDNTAGAIDLVTFLTSPEQQLAFAKGFGVMPSVKSAEAEWSKANPEMAAFIKGAEYAQNLPAQVGAADVIKDFNSELSQLKTKDPKAILDQVQSNLQPVVEG